MTGSALVTISPSSLADGFPYVAYNQTLSATGGTAPYTWAVVTGALPTGLSMSSGGVISGTASIAGDFVIGVRATDASGMIGLQTMKLKMVSPILGLTPTTLSAGTVGQFYTQALTASGGTGPYTWSVVSGNVPAGMTLSIVRLRL